MKKGSLFLILLMCFALPLINVSASGALQRNATKVGSSFEPYTADQWIISPVEEPTGDQKVSNAPECDIKGVLACYDPNYLRVDILLQNEISFQLNIFYAVKFEYNTMNEYFTYYTDSKELIYEKEENGKITEQKILTVKNSKDVAGISDSGDQKNSDVYFIISKQDHINGEQGKWYYLTSCYYSGYLTETGALKIADETSEVDLKFEY